MTKRVWVVAAATASVLGWSGVASAATLTVDDDGADCPTATYTSVQAAVDAAASGDTVVVCPGQYSEGTGLAASNALTITKSLTIRGAGADLVTISPKASGPAGGQIAEATPNLRDGIGDVVSVVGAPTAPITVNLSGLTVSGYAPGQKPVVVEAGVDYLDADGSILRSRVTNTVTSEGDSAYQQAGGYRNTGQPGVGIVQTSAARIAPVDGTRTLDIESTRVDKYNTAGILIDGATGDTPPYTASGAIDRGLVYGDQVIGRTECINYTGTGNCSTVGPVTTGPLFGQDGLRVTSGARALVNGSLISQNVVQGTGAPVRGSATNNANLSMAAGIRLVGARMTTDPVSTGLSRTYNTSVTHSDLDDNAYGAINLANDGVTANTGAANIFRAEFNWWGLRITGGANNGPAISPTTNPPFPENPVNGTTGTDGTGTTGTTGDSTAVDFYPYRAGNQADSANPPAPPADPLDDATGGEYAIPDAPMPVSDAAPTGVTITADSSSAAPGATITLTATASDDFGVKRVRFYDGATLLGTVTKPPYTLAVTLPADAAGGTTHTYTAVATDSADQSTSSAARGATGPGQSATVTVTSTAPSGPSGPGGTGAGGGGTGPGSAPGAPTVSFVNAPKTLRGPATLTLAVNAPAGLGTVQLRLGGRLVCSFSAPPFSCKLTPTGADVGTQTLTAGVTDAAGATASTAASVTVAKFRPSWRLSLKRKSLAKGRVRRTLTGTLVLPTGVTAAQGCTASHVTLVLKKKGARVLDQQLTLTRSCRFTRSVTASRANQRFTARVTYAGNRVLAATTKSRRFS